MIRTLRSHPIVVASGAAALIAALAWLAFGFFGVHTAFIDEQVSEAAPVFAAPAAVPAPDAFTQPANVRPAEPDPVTAPASPAAPATAAPASPAAPAAPDEIVTEFSGEFRTIDKETTGRALVLGNGSGQRFLRFEDFSTGNGPDLDVWLVNSSTGDMSDYIDLGELKGNVGEQNYQIPEDVDLGVDDTVVIWCERFSSAFGNAILEPMI